MTIEELRERIRLHGLWLRGEQGGTRLYLTGETLPYRPDLRGADLQGTDLRGAVLRSADLQGTDLRGAVLRSADLQGTDLRGADLRGADLQGADLRGADLRGADLDVKQIAQNIHRVSIVPQEGPFWAWKAVRCVETHRVVLLQLEVPATAQRLGGLVGRKCRVSEAIVLNATWPDGRPFDGEMCSDHAPGFRYQVGARVVPDSFDANPAEECSNGIHIFMNRMEAVEYMAPSEARALFEAKAPKARKRVG